MKFLIKLSSFSFILLIVGCGGGGGGDSSNESDTQTYVKATINVVNNLGLTSIPSVLTHGSNNTLNDIPIFQWRISFDINNDSIINEGDIFFEVRVEAIAGSTSTAVNRNDLVGYLWEYGNGTNYYAIRRDEIELNSTDFSHTFRAPVSLHPSLSSISNGTQVFVQTTYHDNAAPAYYFDYYPSKDTYTVGLDTGLMIDGTRDYETYTGPVNVGPYYVIDIQSVSVNIE